MISEKRGMAPWHVCYGAFSCGGVQRQLLKGCVEWQVGVAYGMVDGL
jgi:hypothetical protein